MNKHLLNLRSFLALLIAFLLWGNNVSAQVYLLENFDSAFVGSPGAPPGWTQTRHDYAGNGLPVPHNTAGPKDWERNRLTPTGVWTLPSFTTNPISAVTDSGVLYMEDYNFGLNTNFSSRRIESPAINLASSTNPYIRFNLFFGQTANYLYPIIVVASNDNGATWKQIMHVQPNFAVATTSTTGTGTFNSSTPWQKITVKIPDAYKVANAKFGFYRNNPYSFSQNPFIDSLTVEEFTPTTITSAQSGNWSSPSTWVGGVVPNANNNVIIAATHTVTSDVNISRMQNLTIEGGATFRYFSTSTGTVSQIFGNLTVDTLGTFNLGTATSTAVGRTLYVGGNIVNNGTMNMGTSTAATLYMTGGSPSTISGNGVYSNNYISVMYFANSAGTTFDANLPSPIVIRNTCHMVDGPINPNGKLTIGISGTSCTILKGTPQTFFTSRPNYPNLGTALRSVTYGGGTNFNYTMGIHSRDTIFTGFETDTLATGVQFIRGTLQMFTQHHVKLTSPLQVGDTLGGTTVGAVGGATTFSRGLLFTSDVNMLTIGLIGNGSTGIAPALNTVTPPNSHGSYVVGPIRFVRPRAGTLTSTFSVPLGYGTEYCLNGLSNNVRRYLQVSSGSGWNGQIVTFRALSNPTGSVSAPQSSLLTNKMYRMELAAGQTLPAASILTVSTQEEAGSVANKDVLLGNQDQLFIMQSTTPTGPWVVRSNGIGAGAFATNTLYTRSTATIAPGPVSGNGEFIAWGTSAPLMNFQNGDVAREVAPVSIGAQDMPMLRVRVAVNGTIPTRVSQLVFNSTGTSRLAAVSSAKVYYTGNSANFSNATQFGSTVTTLTGAINVTGNQTLVNGDNYFWVAYNVAAGALLGDSLAANLVSITAVDTARILTTTPTTGFRIVSAPMTFVSASAEQLSTVKVEQGETGAEMMRVNVQMSATGAPIPLTRFKLSTNGSGAASNITQAQVYYTGSSTTFATSQLVGTFNAPNGTFYINGNQNLGNGDNYFWVAYNIAGSAIINDSVDVECDSVVIANVNRTVSPSAPAGNRIIRGPYCESRATTTADGEIWNVTIGSFSNTSNCTQTGGPGSTLSGYSNYTKVLAPMNVPAGVSTPFSVNTSTCGGQFTGVLGIWIDLNGDGDFTDAGETMHMSPTFQYGTTVFRTGNFTIPCTATPGLTRMRVALIETGTSPIAPCGTYGYGETEDYAINIVNSAPVFNATNAQQFTGSVGVGSTDVRIMRVPIRVTSSSCTPGTLTEVRFRTTGSSSASDIVNAKLYATGNSNVFATTKLIGTVTNPSGNFSFTTADTLVNDTNYYWLTYDVSATATNNNVLDAIYDSAQVYGNWVKPLNGNPTGNVVISVPMTFVGAAAIHPETGMVETGSVNSRMLRVMIRMSSTGAPVALTQVNLDANGGGDDTSNIANVKIFATGPSPVFSATNQFGTTFVQTSPTGNKYGAFNITGNLTLSNDTNYIWVTYNIKPTAILGDSVDAECTGLTIAGVNQTPTVTAPAGSRKIRQPYCASNATTNFDGEILNVTVGSLNNTTTCTTTGGPGSTLSQYSNFTETIAPANMVAGINIPFSVNTATCGGNFTGVLGIWIDLNQDGDFTDAGETVHMSPTFQYGLTVFRTGNINIPCTATPGLTRMRVVLIETGTSPIAPCGTYGYGETEDYTINIINSAPVYNASTTVQQTGSTSPGATDVKILRVPIRVTSSACNPGTATEFRFRTNGTTAVANIVSAKLYATGNSGTFGTSKLLGTVTAPSGSFSFSVADTLINDTNNYWLAYDVNAAAPNNNVLDAIFDSAQVYGNWVLPSVSNPTGNVVITSPLSYVGSNAIHPELGMVETNSINNRMLRIMVRMSSSGAPVALTQLNLSSNGGGNDTSNINNAKVFFTGNSAVFATTNQFGSTFVQTSPTGSSWGAFNITGNVMLNPDTNYIWVTYDIKGGAILGDSVDAECTSLTIAGTPQTPSTTAPTGSRRIRQPYCNSAATTTADGEILNVTVGTLNNTSSCLTTGGAGSSLSQYSNYTESLPATSVNAGERLSYSVHTATCGGQFTGVMGIWVDWNQDGDFTDAGETVAMTAPFLYGNGIFQNGYFYAPLNATLGRTRMRVALIETGFSPINPCGTYGYGETEDYTIEVLPTTNISYTWNQTGGGNFGTPANWTPSRAKQNMNDRLAINTGNAATFTNVIPEIVKGISIGNNTVATLANNAATFSVWDSINIGNNARVITGDNILVQGVDTNTLGVFNGGTNAGVSGNMRKWFNSSVSSIEFPLVSNTGANRLLSMSYVSLPTTIGSLTASFIGTAPGNNGLPRFDSTATMEANRAAINGYWTLAGSNNTTVGVYNLSLTATGFAGINSYTQLMVIRRADAVSPWTFIGSHSMGTGSNAAPIANRTNANIYGQFGIGSDTAANPLPVELLYFTGKNNDNNALLNWATSTEVNNKGFFVERSFDGTTFETLGFVAGAGNTRSVKNYQYVDAGIFNTANLVYYRLNQVDFDGTQVYSNIVALNVADESTEEIKVYPNPYRETTGVYINALNSGMANVEVLDMQGRVMAKQLVNVVNGTQYVDLKSTADLSSGVYFVRVTLNDVVQTTKIQKLD